jgi:hypothetical protein
VFGVIFFCGIGPGVISGSVPSKLRRRSQVFRIFVKIWVFGLPLRPDCLPKGSTALYGRLLVLSFLGVKSKNREEIVGGV